MSRRTTYDNDVKTKSCPTPGCGGKIMTDELHRDFNAKNDSGKQVCPDCKVKEIYAKFGARNG